MEIIIVFNEQSISDVFYKISFWIVSYVFNERLFDFFKIHTLTFIDMLLHKTLNIAFSYANQKYIKINIIVKKNIG